MIHPNLTTDFGDLFSYNGVRFDNPLYKTKVESQVIYDDANRMVKCIEHTIDTTAYVIAGNNETDATLEDLRIRLTETGAELIYRDKGFGDLIVNSDDSDVEDVEWGPKPKLMSFIPIGNSRTALVHWKVSTRIPECTDAHYRNQLMAGCWTVEWDIDGQGYTVISYSGYIEIPLTFDPENFRRLRDNADAYRTRLLGPVPVGFKRETQKWRLSMDRRRLTFQVADRQLPVMLPKGIPYADVTHDVSSSLDQTHGLVNWENVLRGTLQVTPTEPKWLSWSRFKLILLKRMRNIRREAGEGFASPAATVGVTLPGLLGAGISGLTGALNSVGIGAMAPVKSRTASIIVRSVQFSEPIYKWESSFKVHYQIIGSPLDAILQHSGLWTQPPSGMLGVSIFGGATAGDAAGIPGPVLAGQKILNADPIAWRLSLKVAQGHRGVAGLKYNNSQDALIDLCLEKKDLPLMTPSPAALPSARLIVNEVPPANDEAWPRPEHSWIWWESETVYVEDDHIVRHKPLTGQVTERPPRTSGTGPPSTDGNDRYLPRFRGSVADILQRVSSPSNVVSLIGFAIRYGYRIAPPELLTIQKRSVIQLGVPLMRETLLRVVGGVPIFRLDWRIDYTIGETMADLPLPVLSNPFYNVTGSDGSQTFYNPVQGTGPPRPPR